MWHSFASSIVDKHKLPKSFNLKIIPLDQIVNDRGQLQIPIMVNKNYTASTSKGRVLGSAPLVMELETVYINPVIVSNPYINYSFSDIYVSLKYFLKILRIK